MTRTLLRAINAPVLILICTLLLAFQSTLLQSSWFKYFVPDFGVMIVLWVAHRRGLTEGGIVTLLLGRIFELHSAAPQGTYFTVYMAIFLLARLAANYMLVLSLEAYVLSSIFGIIALKIGSMIIVKILSGTPHWIEHSLVYLFPGAIAQAGFGYLIYHPLCRLDWLTFADPKAERSLENETPIEEH